MEKAAPRLPFPYFLIENSFHHFVPSLYEAMPVWILQDPTVLEAKGDVQGICSSVREKNGRKQIFPLITDVRFVS
jgi:hypothetical protein